MSMNLPNEDIRLTALEYESRGIKSYPSKILVSSSFTDIKSLISGQMEESCTISGAVKIIGVVAEQVDLIFEKLFLRSLKF